MRDKAICPGMGSRLYCGLCILSILISVTALPSFGQQIHQLSYNGSSWADQNLNGVAAQWAVSAFFTTPNDQFHVFYGGLENPQLYQLFNNGSNWADLDL